MRAFDWCQNQNDFGWLWRVIICTLLQWPTQPKHWAWSV